LSRCLRGYVSEPPGSACQTMQTENRLGRQPKRPNPFEFYLFIYLILKWEGGAGGIGPFNPTDPPAWEEEDISRVKFCCRAEQESAINDLRSFSLSLSLSLSLSSILSLDWIPSSSSSSSSSSSPGEERERRSRSGTARRESSGGSL